MTRRKPIAAASVRRLIETAQAAGMTPTRLEVTPEGRIILSQESAARAPVNELDQWLKNDQGMTQ